MARSVETFQVAVLDARPEKNVCVRFRVGAALFRSALGGVVIKFGESDWSAWLPSWVWWEWGIAIIALIVLVLALTIIYAAVFGQPGGIFFVEDGVEVHEYWRSVMKRREDVRGRITKRMAILIGFAVAMLIGSGGAFWWLW